MFRKQVATRLDHLMWGIGAAWLSHFYPKSWNRARSFKALIGLLILLVSKFVLPPLYGPHNLHALVFTSTVGALAVVLLLPFLANWKRGNGAVGKVITRISLISYSAYLLNLSVVILLIIVPQPWEQWIPSVGGATVAAVCSYWSLTLIFSVLLYKYFELPMTGLRDHKRVKRLFALPAHH
jgi:peptidoglycan/LPS O-acetylase OafA/YrhL